MNLSTFKEMTRLEQTFFALPIVITGACLPFKEIDFNSFFAHRGMVFLWIFLAFFFARISGMAFNQWIDWKIDAKNPRTQHRVIPSGRAKPVYVASLAFSSLGLFLFFCSRINILCFYVAPIAAFLIWAYSYTKRYFLISHWVLGSIHYLMPIMAWMAITESVSMAPILLGCAAFCSISCNDIIYALQDYEFDRQNNLYSLPARWGINISLVIARLLQATALISLIGMGIVLNFSIFYFSAIAIVAMVNFYYHFKVHQLISLKRELSTINALFLVNILCFGSITLIATIIELI